MSSTLSSLPLEGKTLNLFGIPLHRRLVTGQKEVPWSAVFILSLVWFTWGFHLFAGGLALAFTINRFTNDPRIIAFIQSINLIVMLGPFISYISDQIWSRLGRRRPFLIIAWAGACAAMFCLAFLEPITAAINSITGPAGVTVTALGLLALIVISYTTMWDLCAPLEPLFLECVAPHQRGRFFAIRNMLFQIAVLIFFQMLWGNYHKEVDLLNWPDSISQYTDPFGWFKHTGWLYVTGEQCIYLLAGSLFAITGFYLLFCIKETREEKAPNRKFLDLFRGQKAEEAAEPPLAAVDNSTGRPFMPVLIGGILLLVSLVDGYLQMTQTRPQAVSDWVAWGFQGLPVLLGIYALLGLVRRAPGAPAAIVIFTWARLLVNIAVLACYVLLTPFTWTTTEVVRLIAMIAIAFISAGYLLRAKDVTGAFGAEPMGQLMRVPIASFMAQYLKDVFLNWANYPFYVVLVIPGIQDQVFNNFGNIMQSKQFGYSNDNQAAWGLPMTLMGIILMTPFSGWYSDLKAGGKWYVPRALAWSWLVLLSIAAWFIISARTGPQFAEGVVSLDHVTGKGYLVLVGLILACVFLSKPAARWLSSLQLGKGASFVVKQCMLLLGLGCFAAWWWFYTTYAPADVRELPVRWATFAVALSAAIGTMFTLIWFTEMLLGVVGHTHARAWVSSVAVVFALGINVALFVNMRMSEGYVIPITLFMSLNVISGSLGSVLGTFNGPMVYEYMPRSRMGTINAGRGLMGDGLRWVIGILGGQWIYYYTKATRYADQPDIDAEKMNFDYTSLYILMFILFVPVLIAQGWFLWRVVAGKVQRWGIMEVEGEDGGGGGEPAEEKQPAAV